MDFYATFLIAVVLLVSANAEITSMTKKRLLGNLTHLSDERKLYHYLLDDYVKDIRPALKATDSISVKFGLAMLNIFDLHEESGILEFNAWLRKVWTDPQLTWNPDDFGGIKSISFPIKRLWRPDIVLYTNAAESDEMVMQPEAVVFSNGMVMWIPHVRVKSWCSLDMTKFPYDEQTCVLKFGSWTYSQEKLDLVFYENNNLVDFTTFNEHPEWDIIKHDGKRIEKVYSCCPEKYPSIEYLLTFQRKVHFFTHIYMAPAILMVLLLPSIFLLPPSANEKIVLGTGIMISLSVILAMLERFLPSDHSTVPVVGMFYLTALVLTALSLAMACFVINISRRQKSSPPPNFIKVIFINLLGRILCVRNDPYTELETQIERPMSKLDAGTIDINVVSGDDREVIVPPRSTMVAASDWNVLALVIDRLLLVVFTAVCAIVCIAMFAN